MTSITETTYEKLILKKFKLPHGSFYFLNNIVVGEINENVVMDWNLGKAITQEAFEFYTSRGNDLVYISNRINQYSVKPADWLKFLKYSNGLKGYGIVTDTKIGRSNGKLESLFIPTQFKSWNSIKEAIDWAQYLTHSDNRD